MGVDIDGSEARESLQLTSFISKTCMILTLTWMPIFVFILVIFLRIFGLFSKVRESPEKAPLWSRWGFYTSTASTQSECYSIHLLNSYITASRSILLLILMASLQMNNTVSRPEYSLWMDFPQALQRLLGPLSHAKQLISPPLSFPPISCTCTVIIHMWLSQCHTDAK